MAWSGIEPATSSSRVRRANFLPRFLLDDDGGDDYDVDDDDDNDYNGKGDSNYIYSYDLGLSEAGGEENDGQE
ncbi:hypothetical protein ElyMa_002077800 [Elysia marginata]|uniref:Uncharacterized protein n=1 Tax=Elysia marginata TaxID=1093978 RepID=A0AAV4FBN4_9GAST|nr:hypothetical protein ElyMa_002077800 [Elysia marginata]